MTVEEIIKAIEKLSDEEREELYQRLPKNAFTTGELIYDKTVDAQDRPIIKVKYDNGLEESIDIIKMVLRDPVNVGHPVVAPCIFYWLSLIETGAWRGYDQKLGQKNIELLANALIEGAKNCKPFSKEIARCVNYVRTSQCLNKLGHCAEPLKVG